MIYVGLGLIVFATVCAVCVLLNVYRGLLRLLDDPDTYKLFDGKESE